MSTSLEIRPGELRATSADSLRLQTISELDRLEHAWRALAAASRSPMQQFSWARSALATIARDEPLCAVALVQAEDLVAVAPLTVRGMLVKRAALAGVAQLREPMDLVWTDERALETLLLRLIRIGRPLFLERVPAGSPTCEVLERVCRGRAAFFRRLQPSCPYISLDESWREPEQNVNAGRRSDLRRARRRAEQIGPLATEILTPELDQLDELLATAIAIEDRSWKGKAGTALARDRARAEFYCDYARAACQEGILRLCFLRIGTQLTAMQLAVEHGGGFWLLKIGYDAGFAACSPGLLLMRDTISYAAKSGLSTYEFLGEADRWTDVWTKQRRPSVSLRVYPFGMRGITALTIDASGMFFQKALDRCRTWKRK